MLGWLPEDVSPYGADIDALFYFIYYLTAAAFIIVTALMLIFLYVYRDQGGRRAAYTHGNTAMEIIWTIIPAIVFISLGLVSRSLWEEIKLEPPETDIVVKVTGKQFNWEILYPGPDGEFDTADDKQIDNDIRVPAGKPVRVILASKDVIHSFFMPNLRFKQDMVPGREIIGWFQANKPGRYEIPCAELCGFGHSGMKGWLYALAPEEYQAWRDEQWPQTASSNGSNGTPASNEDAGETAVPAPETVSTEEAAVAAAAVGTAVGEASEAAQSAPDTAEGPIEATQDAVTETTTEAATEAVSDAQDSAEAATETIESTSGATQDIAPEAIQDTPEDTSEDTSDTSGAATEAAQDAAPEAIQDTPEDTSEDTSDTSGVTTEDTADAAGGAKDTATQAVEAAQDSATQTTQDATATEETQETAQTTTQAVQEAAPSVPGAASTVEEEAKSTSVSSQTEMGPLSEAASVVAVAAIADSTVQAASIETQPAQEAPAEQSSPEAISEASGQDSSADASSENASSQQYAFTTTTTTAVDQGGPCKGQLEILSGATIYDIAGEFYTDEKRLLGVDLIRDYNTHIKDLDHIYPGQKLCIPSLAQTTRLRQEQESGSYNLILDAFRSSRKAKALARSVQQKGYQASVIPRQVSNSLLLQRVEITGLQDQTTASQAWKLFSREDLS